MSQDDALKINPEDLQQWLENDTKPKSKSEKKKHDSNALIIEDLDIKGDEQIKINPNPPSKSRSKASTETILLSNISKVALDHTSGKIDLHIEYHQQPEPMPSNVQQVNRLLLDAFKSLL